MVVLWKGYWSREDIYCVKIMQGVWMSIIVLKSEEGYECEKVVVVVYNDGFNVVFWIEFGWLIMCL